MKREGKKKKITISLAKKLEQPSPLSAHRSAWPQCSSITPPLNLFTSFAFPNAKRAWVGTFACASENVCTPAYVFPCMWVYVRVSARCYAQWVEASGLRRGRKSKYRHKLWNEQSNPCLPWQREQRQSTRKKHLLLNIGRQVKQELEGEISAELPFTHRQTRWTVMGDTILNVGLPRVPWGRTPVAVWLLLGILEGRSFIQLYRWSIYMTIHCQYLTNLKIIQLDITITHIVCFGSYQGILGRGGMVL